MEEGEEEEGVGRFKVSFGTLYFVLITSLGTCSGLPGVIRKKSGGLVNQISTFYSLFSIFYFLILILIQLQSYLICTVRACSKMNSLLTTVRAYPLYPQQAVNYHQLAEVAR